MMFRILSYSLDKIEGIEQYYLYFEDIVQKKAEEEKGRNRLGNAISVYFKKRVSGQVKEAEKDDYERLERQVLASIEIIEVEKDEEGKEKGFHYRYRDKEQRIQNGQELDPILASKNYFRAIELTDYHSQTAIVNLVARFEDYIANFARYIFWKYPQAHINEKVVTFAEIDGKSSEKIKKYFVEREVDELMRKSQDEWFKLFKSHKMRFDMCCDERAKLNEIIARRHMIIHNAGRANSYYINMVKNTSVKEGDALIIDNEYIKQAIICIKIIMYVIAIEAIKLDKTQAGRSVNLIFGAGYDELYNKQYEVAKAVFAALQECSYADDNTKQLSKVNGWIARIELGEYEDIKTEIENYNTEGLTELFVLAKTTLLQQFEEVSAQLKKLLDTKQIGVYEIETWPLFIKYRETQEYHSFRGNNSEYFDSREYQYDKQQDTEKEIAIDKLVYSDSFYSTHLAIEGLRCFGEYSMDQANRMVDAALNNTQIRWIINDPDVKAFYRGIMAKYETEKKKELMELIEN